MIKRIKVALGLKTNRELAKKLNISETSVSRWDKKGFHQSTKNLIILLLEKIENGNKNT